MRPLHRTSVVRCVKNGVGLVCGKQTQMKTGSRDLELKWEASRFHITARRDLLEQTLFVDEHSEFCFLGQNSHNGRAN